MMGPPHITFGTGGDLEALIDGLTEVGLEPQRTKFRTPGTTEEALTDKPEWLLAPSMVIDPANDESFRFFGMKICGAPIGENLFEEKTDLGEAREGRRYYDKSNYSHPIS